MIKNKMSYIFSLLLILISLSIISYLDKQRNQENLDFISMETKLNRLTRLSGSVDRDVILMLSFQLKNFDSLALKVKDIKLTNQELDINTNRVIKSLSTTNIKAEFKIYLKESRHKLQSLEHLKSTFASYKITLRYIPLLISDIKNTLSTQINTELKEQLNNLSSLIFQYGLFKEEQTKYKLQKIILILQSFMLEHEASVKLEKLLFHSRKNIDYRDKLESQFKEYSQVPNLGHLIKIGEYLENSRITKVKESYIVNNIFLLSIVILLSILIFALQYYRKARSHAIASSRMFLDAIESMNESFAVYDKNDQLLVWNKKFEHFYPRLKGFIKQGLSFEQIVDEGIKCKQFDCHNFTEKEVKQLMLVSHKENLKNILEKNSDGRSFLVNSNRTSSGGIASITIDISERQKMEMHLLELSRAVDQSPAAVVITNTKGIISYVNPKFEEVTGYSREEAIGQNPRILKSGETSKQDYKKMWDTILADEVWHGVFHNKRKGGTLFWERATMASIKDENNVVIGYLAIKEDITQNKENEEKLRMASMVFETSSEAIIVTDDKNIIKMVNPSFEKITGYAMDEVIGFNPSMLSSGEQDNGFYKKMWKFLYDTGRWQGEVWNKRKNGEIYPQWLSIALIKDENENIVEHIAVFSDISERKRAEDKIHWQANFDHLTQLPNRSLFLDRLKQYISSYKRDEKSFALLFLDLDRFKIVNDTLGHSAGDELLQEVAKRLQNNLSESDTIARFGGDEFIILLPRINTSKGVAQGAAYVAERLVKEIGKVFVIKGSDVFIGSTIGITIFPEDAIDETALIRNADMAMYHAKESGRNSYHFYTESMNENMLSRMQLEKDLHHAVESNEFFLEYQPVVRIINKNTDILSDEITYEVVGAEALVRWNHPKQGRLGPDQFITLAEETGVIKQLGEWVLDEAVSELSVWHQAGFKEMHIAINVSSSQRLLGFNASRIQASLDKFSLDSHHLTIEMTESLLMDNSGDSLKWLESLHKIGVKLSIDDFGTGYSSLSYLHHFPMDILKVDKSFVDNILDDDKNARLVDSIISLAHNFDLAVVAEGVEEKAQLEFLQKLGCDFIQGYYYSKPLAAKGFLAYIKDKS